MVHLMMCNILHNCLRTFDLNSQPEIEFRSMAKPVVGVISNLPKLCHILSAKLPDINFVDFCSGSKETLKKNEVKVIVADFDLLANVLYDLPEDVKWVQGTWAGADKLLAKYDNNRKLHYTVTRFTGSHFGTMMAEYVISNLVSLERNFISVKRNQEKQVWNTNGNISDYRIISDLKIGVLGIGAIGKHVASALKLLGAAQIWGLVSKIPEKKEAFIDFYRTTSEINEVLKNCNVIVNLLPHTQKTCGLLNMNNLSICKEVVFVNAGRGSIISEEDLVTALHKKYLSSAILDVFNEEPLPKNSPLWNMEQVVITPHVAAVTRSQDVAEVFAQNWALWKDGKVLKHILNFSEGY